ncbi:MULTISPECIES: 1,2-dihydroxy-3-keto-5-methylthiopentene dioxygenase [Sphingobium]|jgi:1,2-dihydroxy-3-keto-5-methylthiopentene dioxygenase|uniref:1,2-dihydroxy-3-keto-5-methylthiopentene dioxygenase n=1 Tax=Sphingobium TaxID=165695 RepID=UPI000DBBB15C|nr:MULTISPECIES: cupin [Sphingobium]KAA9020388.1 cupin [Sphingobium limneticum]MBU0931755.1 cupin [Alphaproteobacteria bacterium]BBD02910.1 1,2-dihydroxy-3-keto-5-methylthiopentene dioxygenase [Sphingobium sp. YG1]
MTSLSRYADTAPYHHLGDSSDLNEIRSALASTGVVLERWTADAILAPDASDADILSAYAGDIGQLKDIGGYRSCDVIRLTPDHPDRTMLRTKFLAEHVHDDDEVRFFVEGAGLFYIRHDAVVHALLCTAGDLIILPADTVHWFDTGAQPHFTAIRLFTTPEGWIARFTGDPIAQAIPLYEPQP